MTAKLRGEVRLLARQWRRATGYSSSIAAKAQHPAARELVALGEPAAPYLIELLAEGVAAEQRGEDGPSLFLFVLLGEILGDGPAIPQAMAGRILPIAQLYLDWWAGRQKQAGGQP